MMTLMESILWLGDELLNETYPEGRRQQYMQLRDWLVELYNKREEIETLEHYCRSLKEERDNLKRLLQEQN